MIHIIEKAITDFDSALDKDERLRAIYEELGNSTYRQNYFDEGDYKEAEHKERHRGLSFVDATEDKLPDSTIQANHSLRAAANHFSLSFHEDNRILFLGDLEKYEINQVVNKLKKIEPTFK